MKTSLTTEINHFLKGISQIMLQENRLTGALFLVGIALNSYYLFLSAIIGALLNYYSAKLLRLASPEDLAKGYFGFNGALIGIGMYVFFPISWASFGLLVFACTLSSALQYLFKRFYPLPYLTTPFILATWAVLLIAHLFEIVGNVSVVTNNINDLSAILYGVGQVMFQENSYTALVFLLALFVNSRSAASWAFISSCLGFVIAHMLGLPTAAAYAGLFGFNAVLTAIALEKYDAFQILVGIIFSVILTQALAWLGLVGLTAPFVLATWAVMLLHRYRFFNTTAA